jgi:hypothetical protein
MRQLISIESAMTLNEGKILNKGYDFWNNFRAILFVEFYMA